MSTVSVTNLKNAASATNNLVLNPDGSVNISGGTLSPQTGFKNRIINGGMTIDQRNNGASGTASGYTVDRWSYVSTQSSKATWQQNAGSVTPPAGYRNYLGATSSSAYSVLAGDTFCFIQAIEGFNVADLGWGTANAQTVTLSFWVRSSLTGTFGGALINGADNRSYPFSYTISSANTWEQKSLTIAGDTTGTWATGNTSGLAVRIGLGSGATFSGTAGAWAAGNLVQPTGTVSVVGTNGATFYITGVQLERGSTATPFEFRSIGTELGLCQRYFSTSFQAGATILSTDNLQVVQTGAYFVNGSSTGGATGVSYPVPMRAAPTITIYSPLTTSSAGKCRKAADGFIFTNGSASFIGTGSFQPAGGDAGNTFQYGWVATAEL
jgi:hypothetical protein